MAILGTGIDIIEIKRIKDALARNSNLLNRIFTEGEIAYFILRKYNPCHIAGNFAAKEAVLKALGTGLHNMDWKDIEVSRDSLGKPQVTLHGNAEVLASETGIKNICISISHSRKFAVAQAIAQGD